MKKLVQEHIDLPTLTTNHMCGVDYLSYFMFLVFIISEDTTYRQTMVKITEPTRVLNLTIFFM